MSLDTGTKLGPYEIVEPIGAGGMGEVYRAQDSRLDRSVAIKVLPEHLSSSPEIRARFEREARAVSSLNHPHICVLHDIGSENGIDFLVMELLDGDTLAARLEKGPLPLPELLKAATQIADALDKAHRQGLVHRDLKPGNIMLTKEGAKLLDFGLARVTETGAGETDLTQSPTLSRPLTAEGAIVGTFQYMSPEQLEGQDADARTDIFAFGAVLYEMATGKRAFEGATQASLIASILKEEPRGIAELQPMTPPALERIVDRCLSKDPDDRWQTARDLSLELQWIERAGSQAGVPVRVRIKRKSRERIAWAMAFVFAAVALALGVPRLLEQTETPRVSRFSLLPPDNSTFSFSQIAHQVSPDGRFVVSTVTDSSGTRQLVVRPFDARDSRVLTSTDGEGMPFWSWDSRTIAYFANGKLMRIAASGGAPQVICDAPSGRGGAWGPDNTIVFAASAGGPLFRVSANGGAVTQFTTLDDAQGEEAHRWPQFLPDGKHVLYTSLPVTEDGFATYVAPLDGGVRKHVVTSGGAAVYAHPGYMIFARDQSLVAQPFDTKKLELTGSAQLTGETPGNPAAWTGSPRVSASSNGVLVHTPGGSRRSELQWHDDAGKSLGKIPLEDGLYFSTDLSPDGRHVAVTRWDTGSSANGDIWIVELARNMATRFTFVAAANFEPIWSPDGKYVVFASDRGGNENIYLKRADGVGDEEPLLETSGLFTTPHGWSPDGEYLVYHHLTKETGYDLWLLPMTGERKPKAFLVTEFNETDAAVSPDGKRIAYRSDESGTWELYVQSFPKGGNKYRVSTSGSGAYGSSFLTGWSPDGKRLFFSGSERGLIMVADVNTDNGFESGIPRRLFRAPPGTLVVTMAPSAKRFLLSIPPPGRAQATLRVVTNWSAALDN